MGFDLAKHGLNLKMGFKTKLVSFLGKPKTVEEKRRGEEEEEEKEEKKKMKERSSSKAKKVWNFGFFVWNYELL